MHGAPTHLALAGSVLVMGTVGVVAAVHLEPYPVPTTGTSVDSSAAPMAQPPALSTPGARPPVAAPLPAVRDAPATRSSRRATVEHEVQDHDRPVRARDLIDLAAAPDRHETVVLGRRDLERAVALSLASRVARGELLDVKADGLERIGRLGAVRLDVDDLVGSGGRHHRSSHAHRSHRGLLAGVLDGVPDRGDRRSGGRHRA